MSKKNIELDKIEINKDSNIVESQTRADLFISPSDDTEDNYMVQKFKKTDEGYLQGRAIVTNVGVFKYIKLDSLGNRVIVRELRPPSEVFDMDSLDSLKLKPITDTHPSEAVNNENISKLQAGFAGDDIRTSGPYISAPMTVTKPETVDGIEKGNLAISCGYTVDLIEQSGTYLGTDYDAIQTNIRYNHIAVNIEKGRAGDAVVMKLDSFDAYHIDEDESAKKKKEKAEKNPEEELEENKKKDNKNLNINKEETMLKKVKIDSVEYEAEARVIEELHKTQEKVDSSDKEVSKLKEDNQKIEAELDSKKDEIEQLKKDNEELKKVDHSDEIEKAVNAKLVLLKNAEKADVELKDDMSDNDIKKAVVLSVYPKADEAKLENQAYLDSRFDIAIETLEENKEVKKKNDAKSLDIPNGDEAEEKVDSEKAYQKMVADQNNAWKINKDNK
jgi:hypothetical protein